MTRSIQGALLGVYIVGLASGQGRPSFDVASVKVSVVNQMGGELGGKPNLGTTPDSVTLRNMPLKGCVQWAYHLKDYQVSGPDWIDYQRYDINAKAAAPVKDEELRKMMQALLADRFKLVVHHEIRELPAYVLTVAKDGIKMKVSEGRVESGVNPVKGPGKLALAAHNMAMSNFAEMLSQPLRRPVLDQTGLQDRYDFIVDLSHYIDLVAVQSAGKEGSREERAALDESTVESAVILALRDELGLQLTAKKAPVDMVVVDHAEKVPAEN